MKVEVTFKGDEKAFKDFLTAYHSKNPVAIYKELTLITVKGVYRYPQIEIEKVCISREIFLHRIKRVFLIFYDKWIKGNCRKLCITCPYKYECLKT